MDYKYGLCCYVQVSDQFLETPSAAPLFLFFPAGYCDTDMTSHRGPKSAYDGARIFTWLATKPPQDFETGSFWIFDGTGVKYEM
jgi:hypothetical protein